MALGYTMWCGAILNEDGSPQNANLPEYLGDTHWSDSAFISTLLDPSTNPTWGEGYTNIQYTQGCPTEYGGPGGVMIGEGTITGGLPLQGIGFLEIKLINTGPAGWGHVPSSTGMGPASNLTDISCTGAGEPDDGNPWQMGTCMCHCYSQDVQTTNPCYSEAVYGMAGLFSYCNGGTFYQENATGPTCDEICEPVGGGSEFHAPDNPQLQTNWLKLYAVGGAEQMWIGDQCIALTMPEFVEYGNTGEMIPVENSTTGGTYCKNILWAANGEINIYSLTPSESCAVVDCDTGAPVNMVGTITDQHLLPGDVNLDGLVNIVDIVTIVSMVTGETEIPSQWSSIFKNADFNNDGALNIVDLVSIVDMLVNSGELSSSEGDDIVTEAQTYSQQQTTPGATPGSVTPTPTPGQIEQPSGFIPQQPIDRPPSYKTQSRKRQKFNTINGRNGRNGRNGPARNGKNGPIRNR